MFLSGGLSFLITFFSIPVIIQVAKDKKLFDEPDERKVHKTVIPTLGGLGIFAGFTLATLLGVPQTGTSHLQYFIAASLVVFFLGLKDDILILSASKKFAGQLIAALLLIKFGGVRLTNMHGFLGIHEIPNLAGIVLSALTIVVITNSFNLIDGVDGLAGSLGILTTLFFGGYFYLSGDPVYAIMAFSLAGSLISFLIYNFSPAKIFMGDTGSLLLGLVNAILVIRFIHTAGAPGAVLPVQAAPAIGFSILMVPLFDTLRVFGLRILNRRSPFSPDRNHIHHFLLDLGFTHRRIALTCLSANLVFILFAWLLQGLGTNLLFLMLFGAGSLCTALVFHQRNRLKKRIPAASPGMDTQIIKTHQMLQLYETADAE